VVSAQAANFQRIIQAEKRMPLRHIRFPLPIR
jgi:hypothetical protein